MIYFNKPIVSIWRSEAVKRENNGEKKSSGQYQHGADLTNQNEYQRNNYP